MRHRLSSKWDLLLQSQAATIVVFARHSDDAPCNRSRLPFGNWSKRGQGLPSAGVSDVMGLVVD